MASDFKFPNLIFERHLECSRDEVIALLPVGAHPELGPVRMSVDSEQQPQTIKKHVARLAALPEVLPSQGQQELKLFQNHFVLMSTYYL